MARCASQQAINKYKITDEYRFVSENLHNRYFLLTTAKSREGTFLTMANAQTWEATV
jgi:hypothetical protein